MAWFPIAAAVVGTVMQMSAASQAASAAKRAGEQQQVEKNYEAQQLDQQAGQEQASSQRAAYEQERQSRLIASRAIAVAGASGGGVTDPTITNIISDLQGEGAYRAAVQIYRGDDNARSLRMGGTAKRYEGDIAAQGGSEKASAYQMSGFGALAKGAGSIYDRFGMGGPTATKDAATGNGWSSGMFSPSKLAWEN